jgi:hypothetical protein
VQERALARAAGADDHHNFVLVHGENDVIEDLAVAKGLVERSKLYDLDVVPRVRSVRCRIA